MKDDTNWQGYPKATNWAGTVHGHRIDFTSPKPEEVDVMDIVYGLGNQCRFTGQVTEFYSIAEHSIHVCELVIRAGYPELGFDALMHDAHEAYVGDVSTPLKREIEPCFKPVDARVRQAVATRFGLILPQHDIITHYDRVALITERDAIQPRHADWGPEFEGYPRDPNWTHRWPVPRDARNAFLAKYIELARDRVPRAVTVW